MMCVKITDPSKEQDASKRLNIFFQKVVLIILLSHQLSAAQFDAEDGRLDFKGLALKYTGAFEEHLVTTEDGYIMKLFRTPGNQSRPVLLMHGLIASSDDFIVRGRESYASTLSKAGYDVWFGNYRGNKHSRRHVTLNPNKNPAFWKFGAHEHGYYDLAASIDFILNKTGEEKLSLIGHSQGTMITYILGSERPEYNNKIKVFIALAPVCHIHHVQTKIPKVVKFGLKLRHSLQQLKIEEVGGYDETLGKIIQQGCGSRIGRVICRRIIFMATGFDADGLELELIPIIMKHYPAGTSRMNLEHFLQMLISKRFAQYDFGPVKNLEKYGFKKPPEYDLTKVTMNVHIIAAKNDPLSLLIDTRLQAQELPNVKEYLVIEHNKFNHIDHLWSWKATKIVHPKVLKILEKYN